MADRLNVTLLGSKFMGRAHSNAWGQVGRFFEVTPRPTMHTVVARNAAELADFAATWGWKNHTTDWQAAVASEDTDLVDIATPNNVHRDAAIAALEAGKHVACEKPLAATIADAEAMAAAAANASGKTFVWFNYRRVPAVALAHRIVASGLSARSITPGQIIYRAGAGRTHRCCGASRAMSPARAPTATSTPTSSTLCGLSPVRRS